MRARRIGSGIGRTTTMALLRFSALALAVMAAALGVGTLSPGVAGAQSLPSWSPQPATYGVGNDFEVPVTMSDGTILRANVYYPTANGGAASGPFPVLLQQTPYGKAFIAAGGALAGTDISYLVQRGYIVVIADVRGTGDSEGNFDLFDPVQSTDGATLARWAAVLPHSDGKVGLFGESYMGINQFQTVQAAGANSPIKAMFPIISGNELYPDTVTQGGIPDLEFSAFYIALLSGLDLGNPVLQPLVDAATSRNWSLLTQGLADLTPVEVSHAAQLVGFLQLIANVETGSGAGSFDDSYWQARSPAQDLASVVADHIPAYLVGGWNDLFQAGEPLNYVGLQNLYDGRPQTAAMLPNQPVTPRYQLMMGPWMHVTTGQGINMAAIQLEWFDTWLLGEKTPLGNTITPLHLQLENSTKWFSSAQWPIPNAPVTPFYLGGAKSGSDPISLNGTLTPTKPTSGSGSDTVLWDGVSSPCDVQTDQWAAGLLSLGLGELDTTDPCDDNDVTLGAGPGALTYTTAPFRQAEIVSGPIDATLYTTSTTTDTELAATVEAVSPSGVSKPLTSGALIGSLRALDPTQTWMAADGLPLLPVHPLTSASLDLITPGQVTEQDIEVFPTMAEIPAGWRLRVTITTGDTPHLEPTVVQAARLLGGVYQIQHNSSAASVLNVPLAPLSAFWVPCGSLCSAAGPAGQ
ncbi:MAG TPA: CocE/NonD family hydrolase [Acidimicrobiales bacterium]